MTVTIRPFKGTAAWEVDIRIEWPDGKKHRVRCKSPVTSKSGSERWGREKERQLYDAGPPTAATGLTLEKFWPDFQKRHIQAERLKPASARNYEVMWTNQIKPQLGAKLMENFTQTDIQEFKAHLSQTLKPSSVNLTLIIVNLMFRKAVEWGILDKVPFAAKMQKVQRRTVAYSPEEYQALVDAAMRIRENPKVREELPPGTHLAFLLLGGDAGLRAGEICGLSWPQVDFAHNRLRIDQAAWRQNVGTPKGTIGSVPMTTRLVEALKYLEKRKTGNLVFQTSTGQMPEQSNLKAWMQRIEREAGMEATGRLHILRHTFCSMLASKGAPANVIKELARHSSLSITERYMHILPGALDQAVALLEGPHEIGEEGETLSTEEPNSPESQED